MLPRDTHQGCTLGALTVGAGGAALNLHPPDHGAQECSGLCVAKQQVAGGGPLGDVDIHQDLDTAVAHRTTMKEEHRSEICREQQLWSITADSSSATLAVGRGRLPSILQRKASLRLDSRSRKHPGLTSIRACRRSGSGTPAVRSWWQWNPGRLGRWTRAQGPC